MKKFTTIVAVAMLLAINTVSAFGATQFKDVPSNHWALSSITKMADEGYILGDLDGNYYPDKKMDKFESSKIFARVAGYKYTGATSEETALYNKAYENNKALLDLYGEKYSKWNSTADREIAYLLQLGVLTANDLNNFVGTTSTGVEGYVALTKEEMTSYMTKAVDKSNEALTGSYSHKFNDDSSISTSYKSYVYYLQKNGVISGDEYNYFYPSKAVSKAEFATVLQRTLNTFGTVTTNSNNNNTSGNIVTGTIYNVYGTNNLIQIKNSNNVVDTYSYNGSTIVTINGTVSSINSLNTGYTVTAVVTSGKVVTSMEVTTNTTNNNNNSNTNNDKDTAVETPMYTIDGVVTLVSNDLVTKKVTIDTEIVGLNGVKSVESFVYVINDNTEIYRNNLKSAFSGIAVGDEVRAEVVGNVVNKIELYEATRLVTGELIEVKYENNSVYPTFVVEFKNDDIYEYVGTKDTTYNRDGEGSVHFTQIKIGDELDVKINYSKMLTVYADGKKTDEKGYVEAIHIDRDQVYIEFKEYKSNDIEKYVVAERNVDIYDLRLGSYVEVFLDSKEVYDIDIIEQVGDEPVTGVVSNVYRDAFNVYSTDYGYIDVDVDDETIFIDSKTGKSLDFNDLYEDMKVLVVFSAEEKSLATTVTVLPN